MLLPPVGLGGAGAGPVLDQQGGRIALLPDMRADTDRPDAPGEYTFAAAGHRIVAEDTRTREGPGRGILVDIPRIRQVDGGIPGEWDSLMRIGRSLSEEGILVLGRVVDRIREVVGQPLAGRMRPPPGRCKEGPERLLLVQKDRLVQGQSHQGRSWWH